ncbi:MAG: alpha-galactosidase, partial [Kiritimatiellae bacterium]|nr:alpha-galactosidase [Kiritimatiellia bacterium]
MKKEIPGFTSVSAVSADLPDSGPWSFSFSREAAPGGAETLTVRLDSAEPAPPPRFTVALVCDAPGVRSVWTSRRDVPVLDPDWGGSMKTAIANDSPVVALVGTDEKNRLAVACSEATRRIEWRFGLREEDCTIRVSMSFFEDPEAPLSSYSAQIRLDAAPVFWSDAVRGASDWICARPEYEPAPVPPAAFDPIYSTWYGFHQDLHDREVEKEAAAAAALGMKTVITDDGWLLDVADRSYAWTGDWEPSPNRFPDMAAHVARVKAAGLRYMLWFSVPFAGWSSKAFKRFEGKFLYSRDNLRVSVLDPRFPEVREYLASTYEKAVRDWGLDGLKLDFIDSFATPDPDPAAAENWRGRDYKSVPEAVLALMKDVRRRVEAVRPGALVEFRQTYMGPAIRSFGNMIRAGDVPADPARNRARVARLRLTSGATAVHSDMLEWNPRETPEQAAQQIVSVLFSVIQYSMRIDRLSEDHVRMVRHWIAWTDAHREALLHGAFRPHRPDLGTPLLEGWTDSERIVSVHQDDLAVRVPAGPQRDVWIVNGSDAPSVVLDLAAAPERAEAFDAC